MAEWQSQQYVSAAVNERTNRQSRVVHCKGIDSQWGRARIIVARNSRHGVQVKSSDEGHGNTQGENDPLTDLHSGDVS